MPRPSLWEAVWITSRPDVSWESDCTWRPRATRFLLLCCPGSEPCYADRIGHVSVSSRFLTRSFQYPLVIYCRRRNGLSCTVFTRIYHSTNWNHKIMKANPGTSPAETATPKLPTDPAVGFRKILCEWLKGSNCFVCGRCFRYAFSFQKRVWRLDVCLKQSDF
jgi:hypothetical protein